MVAANVFGAVFAFLCLNYATDYVFNQPILYCGLKWAVMPLLEPWWGFVLPVLTLYLLASLFLYGVVGSLGVMVVMVLVAGAPEFARTLGALGKVCG